MNSTTRLLCLGSSLTVLLAACGGGGSSTTIPTGTLPANQQATAKPTATTTTLPSGQTTTLPAPSPSASTSTSQTVPMTVTLNRSTVAAATIARKPENVPSGTGSVEIDAYSGALPTPGSGGSFVAPAGVKPVTSTCENFPAAQAALTITAPIPVGATTVVISAFAGSCSGQAGSGALLSQATGSGTVTSSGGDLSTVVFGLTTAGPVNLTPVLTSIPGFNAGSGSGGSGGSSSSGPNAIPGLSGSVNSACYAIGTPGQSYLETYSNGNFSGGTYTADLTQSEWDIEKIVLDTSTPDPNETNSPFPYTIKFDIYNGTVAFSNGQTQCYTMVHPEYDASDFPSPLPTGLNLATVASAQNGVNPGDGYTSNYDSSQPGKITAYSLTGVSQNSGSGSMTLDNGVTGNMRITDYATYTITKGMTTSSALRRVIPQTALKRIESSILRKYTGH